MTVDEFYDYCEQFVFELPEPDRNFDDRKRFEKILNGQVCSFIDKYNDGNQGFAWIVGNPENMVEPLAEKDIVGLCDYVKSVYRFKSQEDLVLVKLLK